MSNTLPPRLAEIIEDFRGATNREKLELLLEFSDALPPLPENLRDHSAMDYVHECMTPVYVYAERQPDGLMFYFDAPPESPTVRGYAEVLREGLSGATPEQVIDVPVDLVEQMGLQHALSPLRVNGMRYILAHAKQLARQHTVS
jgi:cysteine desulfuration protein SufE